MKKRIISVALTVLLILQMIVPSLAVTETIENNPGTNDVSLRSWDFGQSFTPVKDGAINSIAINICKPLILKDTDVKINIYAVNSQGNITGNSLGVSNTVNVTTNSTNWHTFSFNTPVAVNKGSRYLFKVYADDGAMYRYSGNTYSGGTIYYRVPILGFYQDSSEDLLFRVNMTPALTQTSLLASPASGIYGGTVNLSAALTPAAAGKTIVFKRGGTTVGSAVTNASGLATLSGVSLAGLAAGSYPNAITAEFAGDDSCAASSNTADLTVTPKEIIVTADAKSKSFGAADPVLTYASSGLLTGDSFSGTLTRAAGENVGEYAISKGSLSAGSNYAISFTGAKLTITPKQVNVTADNKSKTFGETDPALTYTCSETGVPFTGTLVRAAGENAGVYAITQGSLAAGGNYAINFTGANLTINPKPVTVTADSKTKIFGQTDPVLTYTSNVSGVPFTGAITRDVGEDVGTYAITQSTLDAGGNYSITFVGANLNITPKQINVTADNKSKTYGDVDPALTYTCSESGITFNGELTRTAGENSGTYAIKQGELSAGSNYDIHFIGANLTITPKPVTVTADSKTKIFGAADPALTYTSTGLLGEDAFSGALTRAAGENTGTYAITQDTLSAGDNYKITYNGANLTITPKAVTVTADAKTKIFGEADPALTYKSTGLLGEDAFTGELTREPGENAGTYAITQSTLSAGGNYTITYVGADLTITPKAVTVTADAKTRVFGEADPALTYKSTGLLGEDAFTGELTRADGENAGTYAITQGTLSAGGNYAITYVGADLTITPKAVTVTADSKTKIFGDTDPKLTFTSSGLLGKDSIAGALTRADGENTGTYAITQGTLSAGGNYTITYVGADLTITPKAVTVTADSKNKIFGDTDPALTYKSTGLLGKDAFTGALDRADGENAGDYAITRGTLDAGSNYSITYVGADLTITPKAVTVTADAKTKEAGRADPALTYTSSGLLGSDTFTGALTRTAGENAGTYAITQGTLSAGGNYAINYMGANLTITAIRIQPNPVERPGTLIDVEDEETPQAPPSDDKEDGNTQDDGDEITVGDEEVPEGSAEGNADTGDNTTPAALFAAVFGLLTAATALIIRRKRAKNQ